MGSTLVALVKSGPQPTPAPHPYPASTTRTKRKEYLTIQREETRLKKQAHRMGVSSLRRSE